jgi:hypothetical protein
MFLLKPRLEHHRAWNRVTFTGGRSSMASRTGSARQRGGGVGGAAPGWVCCACLCALLLNWMWVVRADPALTIYNQNFAVVRDTIRLDLTAGTNSIAYNEATFHVEPASVVLRDRQGRRKLQILEQNFRADPISQELLLNLFEGQTIDFQVMRQDKTETVRGKIIRSGYVPHVQAYSRYGPQYAIAQSHFASPSHGTGQPIVEVEGQLRFGLPGQPLFPNLGDAAILKPTLHWVIQSDAAGPLEAELSYVTGGMKWEADYNMMAAGKEDELELAGWVTIDNQSGKGFNNANIKLMAGTVRKIPTDGPADMVRYGLARSSAGGPPVREEAFDEYHLYRLERKTTLRDRETKQVEFVRAAGVKATRFYVYDGARIPQERYRGYSVESIRQDAQYGTESNPSVWVMLEVENTKENQLGMPLPQGRVRFYRQHEDGALEFTGEDTIRHTPRNEKARFATGNAFDLVGQRRRTEYRIDHSRRTLTEAFSIEVRNRKTMPVEVRVIEHLYRGSTWAIAEKSNAYVKLDSQQIEFRVQIAPDQEQTLTYTVNYTW